MDTDRLLKELAKLGPIFQLTCSESGGWQASIMMRGQGMVYSGLHLTAKYALEALADKVSVTTSEGAK